jgi:cellulose synthase/poly-beta-1,6-N-acetylglucosamine synthase-like glycosyltransferase
MDTAWGVFTLLSFLAVLEAAALALFTYENARHFRSRLRARRPDGFTPRVELFVPCKGLDPGFESMVRTVLHQDYPLYGVTFVVESEDDPAYQTLRPLLDGNPAVRARLVVAGLAKDCGQKVHNLRAATAYLDPAVEVLAFADSDTQLPSEWLLRLVAPLRKPKAKVGAVTGYRWFFSLDGSWSASVFSAMNSQVTFAYGNHFLNHIWGGSWAIMRTVFDALDIPEVWRGAVTEDLALARIFRRSGLRVVFEPHCLVASPIRGSWADLLEFARRQYLIVKMFAPDTWWLTLLGVLLFCTVFWGGVVVLLAHRGADGSTWWIAALLAFLYAVGILRALLRRSAIRARFPGRAHALNRAIWLDILTHPLLALIDLGCILSSAPGRSITWRGIRYRIQNPHHTTIVSRSTPTAAG